MDEKVVWESDSGTFLKINVKPNSRKKNFLEFSEEEIVVNLQSPAKDGKANLELLKRLSRLFRLSTGDLKIISGHKSKTKVVFIEGISIEKMMSILHII